MGNKAHPDPKCKDHSEMVLGGQREPTWIRLRRVSVPGSPHPPTGLLVLLLLPRERLVRTRVPGRRRELHGAAWGPLPGRHALCAGRRSGGRGPEPVCVGQLQGRRVCTAEVPSYPLWPRGLSPEKPGQEGAFEGVRSGGAAPTEPQQHLCWVVLGNRPSLESRALP